MILTFWSWLTRLFRHEPPRDYIPDQDPDVLQLRKQRQESVRETQKFLRQQQRHTRNVVEGSGSDFSRVLAVPPVWRSSEAERGES
jgi:hypothetical protein